MIRKTRGLCQIVRRQWDGFLFLRQFMTNLEEAITQVIQQLIDQGFQYPIHWALLATDGTYAVGVFEKAGKDVKIKAGSENVKVFTFPINIMVVDAGGEVASVLMKDEDSEVVM